MQENRPPGASFSSPGPLPSTALQPGPFLLAWAAGQLRAVAPSSPSALPGPMNCKGAVAPLAQQEEDGARCPRVWA